MTADRGMGRLPDFPLLVTALNRAAAGDILVAVLSELEEFRSLVAAVNAALPDIRQTSLPLMAAGGDIRERVTAHLTPFLEDGGRVVCHLAGFENLPNPMRLDLFGVIDTIRGKGGETAPRSPDTGIVWLLWLTPLFDRQLYFTHPGWYRGTGGIFYLLSQRAEAAGPVSGEPPPGRVVQWLERIIHQYENWAETRVSTEGFLIPSMGRADLFRTYVPVVFVNPKGRRYPMEELLKAFLAGDVIDFLVLTGGSGTGKTSFAVWYFVYLALEYITAPRQRRIPVFVWLKDHVGRFHPETFLMGYIERMFGIRPSLITLQDMLLRGRFVFFIDGFDEMASAGDRYLTIANLEEIAKLAQRNTVLEQGIEKEHPANKIFLICRDHYVLDRVWETTPEEAGLTPLFRELAARENFRITRVAPKFLEGEELQSYIAQNVGDGITARNLLRMMETAAERPYLAPAEWFREMTLRVLPAIQGLREMTPADVYHAVIESWCARDDWRFHVTSAGRRELLIRLALKMFQKGVAALHYSDLMVTDPRYLKEEVRNVGYESFAEELNTCEFVTRDEVGSWRFIHVSFQDYLVAEGVFRMIHQRRDRVIPPDRLTEGMHAFLRDIVASAKGGLSGLDLSGIYLEGAHLYQAALEGSSLNKARLAGAVLVSARLVNADLASADMTGVRATRAVMSGADLSGANLSGAGLREAVMDRVKLNGVVLSKVDLRGANLREARLAWADLREANLEGADLTGAVLTDADLTGTNLLKARLTGADFTGAILIGAVLEEAEAGGAKFINADLSNADLTGARLDGADLRGATLAMAKLEKASLREAGMTRIKAVDVDLRGADLRGAVLREAKLQEAKMTEADLTGADLRQARLNGADLSWAILNQAQLMQADFTDARLHMARLIEADARRACFESTDLTWADATRAILAGVDFRETKLGDADLTGAILVKSRFKSARLKGTSLRGADLRQITLEDTDLSEADLSGARR